MIKILMFGGTGVIGQALLQKLGNNKKYLITVTSRKKRDSAFNNVRYVCGNANDSSFINTFSDDSYDVLIDFMNYKNENLVQNFDKIISIADQYIFLSSARVYDNAMDIIDEQGTLLVDTTEDSGFRNSGTYAIKKAIQEKWVKERAQNKITIVRPYKTYSSTRLQFGQYEIKHWLNRLLKGKAIVVNKRMLEKYTTLTSGLDVANGIKILIGNKQAYGETYQIVSNEFMTWRDVWRVYNNVLKKYSVKPRVYIANDTKLIDHFFESGYQMTYDILFDRKFNSSKIEKFERIDYEKMEKGLTNALEKYLSYNMPIATETEKTSYDRSVDEFIKNNKLDLWKE